METKGYHDIMLKCKKTKWYYENVAKEKQNTWKRNTKKAAEMKYPFRN